MGNESDAIGKKVRKAKWEEWIDAIRSLEGEFTASDIARVIEHPTTPPGVILNTILKKGLIHRLKKGVYCKRTEITNDIGTVIFSTEMLTVQVREEEAMSFLSEAAGAACMKVGLPPESRERNEFMNDQILWHAHRLRTGPLALPSPGNAAPARRRLVLFPYLDSAAASAIRECLDMKYDERRVDADARVVIDALFEQWVYGLYSRDGFVPTINEHTGEPVVPSFLLSNDTPKLAHAK